MWSYVRVLQMMFPDDGCVVLCVHVVMSSCVRVLQMMFPDYGCVVLYEVCMWSCVRVL